MKIDRLISYLSEFSKEDGLNCGNIILAVPHEDIQTRDSKSIYKVIVYNKDESKYSISLEYKCKLLEYIILKNITDKVVVEIGSIPFYNGQVMEYYANSLAKNITIIRNSNGVKVTTMSTCEFE